MSRTHTVRHNLPVALLLSVLLLVLPAASATAGPQEARYTQVSPKVCPVDWRIGTWHVRKLIRCAAFRYHVPGGATKALAIANRESHFDPGAYNAYSGAAGIYQHLSRYWPGRAYTFGFKGYSAFNARANIIVTMRMVTRYGWSPWGG
jgi:hypothetical protein